MYEAAARLSPVSMMTVTPFERSALTALQDTFRERTVHKTYAALVVGHWPKSKKVVDVALHKFLTTDGERRVKAVQVQVPGDDLWQRFLTGNGKAEVSTTVAFVAVLQALMRDKALGKYVVPIVCDEARTFGMESMFKPFGIYSSVGQLYTAVDADFLMG